MLTPNERAVNWWNTLTEDEKNGIIVDAYLSTVRPRGIQIGNNNTQTNTF